MTHSEIDLIASAVAAELRRSGALKGPRRRGMPRAQETAFAASEIAAAILRLRTPGRAGGIKSSRGFSQTVSVIASQVVAQLRPNPTREDLPMERIEI